MKHGKLFIKFLILALCICGAFTLTSCFSSVIIGSSLGKALRNCGSSERDDLGMEYVLNEDGQSYALAYAGEGLKEVVIPATFQGLPVTKIATEAFCRYNSGACSGSYYSGWAIDSLTIPESITEIENYAFVHFGDDNRYGEVGAASTVEKIYYNGTLEQWLHIRFGSSPISYGSTLYINGTELTSLTVPQTVTRIGYNSFSRYSKLESVQFHDGVTEIGERAFYGTGIIELILPENLTVIYDYAFKNCKSLSSVQSDANLKEIRREAFYGCEKLTEADLSACRITDIPYYCFGDCPRLTCVKIPATVKNIESEAFVRCIRLCEIYNLSPLALQAGSDDYGGIARYALAIHKSLDEPSVIAVKGDFLFARRTEEDGHNYLIRYTGSDKEITLPDDLDGEPYKIVTNCFNGSKDITHVTVPNGVDEIGEKAFYGCSSLKTLIGGDSVTVIGDSAFGFCESLADITLPQNLEQLGASAFDCCKALKSVSIGPAVKEIKISAFRNSGITEVTLSEGLETLGNFAFGNCENLRKINLPSTLKAIGQHAFIYCTALQEVTVPAGVSVVESGTFYGSGINSAILSEGVTKIETEAFGACKNLSAVELGNGLTFIGSGAFVNDTALTSLHIPASVTGFGGDVRNPFISGCYSLTTLTVGEGNEFYYGANNCIIERETKKIVYGCAGSVIPSDGSVQSIASYAFFFSGIRSVTIPSTILKIGGSAFSDSKLQSLEFKSAPELGTDAFAYCKKLTEIKFAEGTEVLGQGAFSNCTALKNITFPQSLRVINDYAFSSTGIINLNIPEGVTEIGEKAFVYSSVEKVYLPESLKTIRSYAFGQCDSLKEIHYAGTKTQWNNITKSTHWFDGEIKLYCKGALFPVKLRN